MTDILIRFLCAHYGLPDVEVQSARDLAFGVANRKPAIQLPRLQLQLLRRLADGLLSKHA